MKRFNKLMLFSVAFLAMAVTGCGNSNGGENSQNSSASASSQPQPEPAGPSVFVLTGQSNMEGNSSYNENSFNTMLGNLNITDGEDCLTGIEEVKTSFYGTTYDELYDRSSHQPIETNIHSSNTETGHKIDGKFLPTKVGMGHSNSTIGPELGAAYVLREHADADNPIYFIKCSFGGSGFAQNSSNGDGVNWNVEKEQNLYVNHLKPYTQNCLDLIEQEAGEKPVIKAFLWNQGESDADNAKIPLYNDRFDALVGLFKTDFEDYAPNGDGDVIAVIDALIYEEGKATTQSLNDTKLENIARHENYYYVDATHREGGMALTMGGDNLHYDLISEFKLGMAYGQSIIDNNLLD